MILNEKRHSPTLILIRKVKIFNEIILNKSSNNCPSKTIICNDNDLSRLTDSTKTLIEEKVTLQKIF